jgi:hypothetical protein
VVTFSLQVGQSQTEAHAATANATPWRIQSTIQSSGKFQIGTILPPTLAAPIPAATPFSLQNQITESLVPISTSASGAPLQAIQISATDSASGTVSTNLFPAGLTIASLAGFGSTHYQEQLKETIVYPPGPTQPGATQTLSEAFDTSGVFQATTAVPIVAVTGITAETS